MNKRIIIIGGAGFLGKYLIEDLLKNGIKQIVVLDIIDPKDDRVTYTHCDISKGIAFNFDKDDIVVHLAARQYHLEVPKKNVLKFFCDVNVEGTKKVLQEMEKANCLNLIYFSTDMVYGLPKTLPIETTHERNPIGEYGKSKKMSEDLCFEYRKKGFNICIFRPRMIVGKGRMGILYKLFKLIDYNLPLPMIGGGNNAYQMVSVIDCSSAILKAIEKNIPNEEYNLGSSNPPKVKNLLKSLIKENKSKSFLIPTYAPLVKFTIALFAKLGIRIMYKEQYSIADKNYLVSVSKTENDLGWKARFNDTDMLNEAFKLYKSTKK